MKGFFTSLATLLPSFVTAVSLHGRATGPFLSQVDNFTWVMGNQLWNVTQGQTYGVKLYFKDRDCVGDAVGHYVSYNGAASNLNWTSATIAKQGTHGGSEYIDVKFTAKEGDMHWVIFSQLGGAYQYFVNHGLPELGEFRTLWRLDNTNFPKGKTDLRDEELPSLDEYLAGNKVQDETWLNPDGSGYITKYDFTSWIRTQLYYGVYGDRVGSWYINAGKDYYNGNHLKQELMVHRESSTGDAVQLNMIHGTHFQVSSDDVFLDGKMWGPWLWYLNNGSKEDADVRANQEFGDWPYSWLEDEAYQARGSVKGKLTALDMGRYYYYTSYADAQGNFEFEDVRTATYGLQAWSNGSEIADVTTSFLLNDVVVAMGNATDLKTLKWQISEKTKLFQIGDFDRTDYGFLYGGAPHQHSVVDSCPADLTFTVGKSSVKDWCFGQSKLGNWTVAFDVAKAPCTQKNATLVVSLAGYSTGVSSNIYANDVLIGNLTSGTPKLLNDPSLYRSGTTAGEWRYFEFPFSATVLKHGGNEVTFQVTRNTTWHGFMWDSIVLEW
ncbi:polysaccharide lyase family 4 protein [Xylariales sp. AK1849]|nr:polysaccharide lyase family 4 protein [Xylariales sp. AK1849]